MGHIDPSTGRNKRETGKLARRVDRYSAARASGERPRPSGGIRMSAGRPAERRVTWRQRERIRRGR